MISQFTAAVRSPTGLALLAANLIPLGGVLFGGWEIFPVMLLFWLENVAVGAFNLLRILTAGREALPPFLKLFMLPFFTFHYGMFTFVHGIFVFVLFGGEIFSNDSPVKVGPDDLLEGRWGVVWEMLTDFHLQWALLALMLSHGFSFFWNYLGKGEYRRTNAGRLMSEPYHRVIVLHVVIIFGGFVTMLLGAPLLALVLLVLLKTGIDLAAHGKEHAPTSAEDV